MKATFHPQAWQNDYAIPVDPQGPTEWTVSPEYLEKLVEEYGMEVYERDMYESDLLRHDRAAPEWVREWTGPFYVSMETENGVPAHEALHRELPFLPSYYNPPERP